MAFIFSIILMVSPVFSKSIEGNLTLRSLSGAKSQKFSRKSKDPHVFILFQPNCSVCHAQVADLACIGKKASVNLVGTFASEPKLRKEYKKFGTSLPAFFGDDEFKKEFEVTERLSPQVILAQNDKVEVIFGYKPCKKILKKIAGASQK